MSNYEALFERPTGKIHPREALMYGITEAILDSEVALFEVLPGVGKSRSITKAANGLKVPVTVLTNLTDNYGQYEDWGEEDGIDVEKLPKRDLCPTLRDENPSYQDDTVAREARNALNRGWSPSEIHREFELPCQRGGKTCPYRERVAEIDTDGLNPLVGNHVQAYNPSYVEDRVVVLDEDAFDEYYEVIKRPAKLAQEFIDTLENFPLNELQPLTRQKGLRDEVLSKLENIGLEPSDHTDSVGEFHAKAPLIAYAIYGGEELDNGLKYTELPGDRTAVFERLYETSGDDHDDGIPTMWFFDLPDFSGAEAVIGLDATPCLSKWERVLGEGFKHYRLFGDQERNQYLHERGYDFTQLHNYAWPAQGGNLRPDKCEAYLREVYHEHGERPDLITSKAVRNDLQERGLDHLWNDSLYYGDVRGRNDLKDSELLVVLGSPSRPDSYYKHLAALFGESAERDEDTQGMNLSFGSPIADDILDTLRRGDVFQSAMRAGRKEDAEATIYIATGLVPEWLKTEKVGQEYEDGSFDACKSTRTDKQKAVIEAMQGEEGISAGEIIDKSGVKRKSVGGIRRDLQEQGLIEKEGERRWARYSDRGIESLNIAGEVDLSPIPQTPLKGYYKGIRGIESPLIPRRDLPDNPANRYPDWMRDIQRKASERRQREQEKRRGDGA